MSQWSCARTLLKRILMSWHTMMVAMIHPGVWKNMGHLCSKLYKQFSRFLRAQLQDKLKHPQTMSKSRRWECGLQPTTDHSDRRAPIFWGSDSKGKTTQTWYEPQPTDISSTQFLFDFLGCHLRSSILSSPSVIQKVADEVNDHPQQGQEVNEAHLLQLLQSLNVFRLIIFLSCHIVSVCYIYLVLYICFMLQNGLRDAIVLQ